MADSQRLDNVLKLSITVLLVVIVALGAWFGYSVYRDRKAAEQSTPALRLLGTMKKQVSRNPNDAALRIRLGEAYAAANQIQNAIEQFNAALKIQPKHTGALLDLGLLASSQNRPDEARTYFQKVVDLTAGSDMSETSDRRERAFYQLGLIEYGERNYDAAIADLKAALRIRGDASDTYFYLAHSLEQIGEREEAIRNLQIGLQFDPNFSQALYFLGQLYLEEGDRVSASQYAGRSAQLSPEAPEPKALVDKIGDPAKLMAEAKASAGGDIEAAVEAATIAANLDPANIAAAKLKADLLLKSGADAEALKAYQAAQKLAPADTKIAAAIKKLQRK